MKRRDVLRLAGATVIIASTGVFAKEETKNRKEMKPKNPAKPTDFELKHMPSFTIGAKDKNGYTKVHISVGQGIEHPSTKEHWIDFIDLYADGKLVGKSILEPEISRGYTSFEVKLDGVKELTSHAGCNLHGIWSSTVTL